MLVTVEDGVVVGVWCMVDGGWWMEEWAGGQGDAATSWIDKH
jgi:hypothetical protein